MRVVDFSSGLRPAESVGGDPECRARVFGVLANPVALGLAAAGGGIAAERACRVVGVRCGLAVLVGRRRDPVLLARAL